jgi:6-phosphofructokinase
MNSLNLKENNIILEKRKRFQSYTVLNSSLALITYFDFFSKDTFQLINKAKLFSQASNENEVIPEILLIPFFNSTLEVSKILQEYDFDTKVLEKSFLSISSSKKTSNNFSFQFNSLIDLGNEQLKDSINYSYDVLVLFEKAVENSLNRFKSPIITPEILLVTIMEEKNLKISQLFRSLIKNETEWYVLRYKLMKRIHSEELTLRNELKRNYHFFGYLLRSRISSKQFDRLTQNNLFNLGVIFFRSKLLNEMMKISFLDYLYIDIQKSVKLNKNRKYNYF